MTNLFKSKPRKTWVFTRSKNRHHTPYLNFMHAPVQRGLTRKWLQLQLPNFGNLCCEYLSNKLKKYIFHVLRVDAPLNQPCPSPMWRYTCTCILIDLSCTGILIHRRGIIITQGLIFGQTKILFTNNESKILGLIVENYLLYIHHERK